ncbi:polyprenyl synthetase family protein [Spongiibacter marinus]|uniref:polyprenyl synthetase family protein n=1 Tax=Spongiibacter marinus TaxID=354246 RepID=UPI003568313E
MPFDTYLQQCQSRLQRALPEHLAQAYSEFSDHDASEQLARLTEASQYSIMNGGKRVRATLVYATAQTLQAGIDDATLDSIACAIEMIHAYSLVHDDLPAMDDDDLRRGKPTCHIAYDEATAILVGDGLQSRAFELIAELPLPATHCVAMVKLLAAASGPRGMVGGQAIDLANVNRSLDLHTLQTMHQLKTGALIRAAIGLTALACGASASQQQQLDDYGKAVGLAFQVQDDILDIEGDTATLGKTQGADISLNKPTFPSLLGLDGAKDLARQLHQQAVAALSSFGGHSDALHQLSNYIIERQH